MGAYWPDGVTMPQHLWPFFQTGDYSDQGSTGGLTLTAGGSGNSFDANGLNFDGNGWAYGTNNSDISDLGATFSIISDIYLGSLGLYMPLGTTSYYTDTPNSGGIMVFIYSDHKLYLRTLNPLANLNEVGSGAVIDSEVLYQLIWVQDSGSIKAYVNNSKVIDSSIASPVAQATYGYAIGAVHDGGGFKVPNGSYIKRAGFLKGTAWTSDDVATIYAWSPAVGQPYRKRLGGIPYAALNKGVW